MRPLVSIGMPVFNCGDSVVPAIRSIINQTYENWELLIVDDGSSDNTKRFVENFDDKRIRVFSDGRNLGLAARLNQTIDLSRGKYFARMDGDDIAYPGRFEAQVAYLEKHAEIDLVGCRVLIFKAQGLVVGTYPFRQSHADICRRPWSTFHLPHPTWMGKIDWFHTNRYRTAFKKSEDQELLLRTYRESRFACLPEILLGYRKTSLSLKTILWGRYELSSEWVKKSVHEKHFLQAFKALEQAVKAVVEIFAVSTGLNYRILRHRAIPVDQPEISRWHTVWIASTSP